jgi:histidine triad (HIT) family protein
VKENDGVAECLFCRIANKELESDIVFESDDVLAFRDINPVGPTHVLVIPKRHIASTADLTSSDARLLGEIFETLASIARSEGISGGHRIVTNSGPEAGQSVDHLHFHLIGGRAMSWPPG